MITHLRRVLLCLSVLFCAAPVAAQVAASEFAARRGALMEIVGDGVTLVLGALPPSLDYLTFQQSRPFFYLTGFREAEAALLIVQRGAERTEWIFVQPNDAYSELWTGQRLGAAAAREHLGIDGREYAALQPVLDSLLWSKSVPLYVAGDLGRSGSVTSPHKQIVEGVRQKYPGLRISDVTAAVASVRAVKSPAELERIRIAAGITARGHLAAMRLATPGVAEFELQAAAEHEWRREGAEGPGFGSILASGPNATTLHYLANTRVAESGDLVVMDLGASFDGYTADITRTIPVNGKFTSVQREIYQTVLDAQKAAERQVWLGAPAQLMSDSANAVLAAGLTRLGLIESPNATYDCGSDVRPRQCPQLGLFYLHSLGHGIGLDVHDPVAYYETGVIDAGAAFTIEPGIYVRRNVLELLKDTPRNRALAKRLAPAVARYADVGVRIEDDYVVTADGVERISAEAPREISEVEALLTMPRTPRVPGAVERFLRTRTGR